MWLYLLARLSYTCVSLGYNVDKWVFINSLFVKKKREKKRENENEEDNVQGEMLQRSPSRISARVYRIKPSDPFGCI